MKSCKILGLGFTLWGKIAGYSNLLTIGRVPFFTQLQIYWKAGEVNLCNGFFGQLGPYSIRAWLHPFHKQWKYKFYFRISNYNKLCGTSAS